MPEDERGLFHSREVKNTYTNEAIHFASSYAAKSALWLIKLK